MNTISEKQHVVALPSCQQKRMVGLLCGVLLLIVYVLSAGPMAGLVRKADFRPFSRAAEILYTPLVLLVKAEIEPFASLLKWYVSLFR